MSKKMIAKILSAVVACLLIVGIVITVLNSRSVDRVWKVKFKGTSLNLSTGFEEVVKTAVKGDIIPVDIMKAYVYDEYGKKTKDIIVKLLEETGKSREDILYITFDDDYTRALTDILGYGDNLPSFKFASGVTYKTKATALPGKFVCVGPYDKGGSRTYDGITTYMALVVDGKYVNLDKTLKSMPDELSDEDIKILTDFDTTFGSISKKLIPDGMLGYYNDLDWKKEYKESEEFRNTIAVMLKLTGILYDFYNGDISNFGTISYTYIDGVMDSARYKAVIPSTKRR